ncbi:uncharacterized protein DNG_00614 [Cephalotrichum gorgonifer]|uniref:GRF-type domain-containing protein n=1 Tax=Cephalotrichum gorgonifer TaxID=2041049 RepID=A0AAE8MPH1_9PEZI|nr:uncharacterized protein DNG_00614 [Cephalotrichum gorgonifer]
MFPNNRPRLISQRSAAHPASAADPEARDPETAPAPALPPSTPPKQLQQYGLYQDSKWYCNCEPRARATFRTVKKDGPNKDRCFYSCPDKDNGCDFFYWLEEAQKRSGVMGDTGPAATTPSRPGTTPSRPRGNHSIRKYFHTRESNGGPAGQETPSRSRGEVVVVSGDQSPSPPSDGQEHQPAQGGQGATMDRPSTPPPPANRSEQVPAPTTPTRVPKRPREDADDYPLSDFSSGEEEAIEQILSAASGRTNMSPPTTTAETPTRRLPELSSSTSGRPSAIPTPPTRTSLATKRQRVLASTPSAQTPSRPETPQTPHANTAASTEADVSTVLAIVRPHVEPAVLASLEGPLNRIAMKAASAVASREMVREALKDRERRMEALAKRNVALENEVKRLKDGMTKLRGGMMNLYQDT